MNLILDTQQFSYATENIRCHPDCSVDCPAGCQDSTDNGENGGTNDTDNESETNGNSGNGGENGTEENSINPPEWLDWLPATAVRGQSVVTVIDTDEMREDFPDTYESSPTADIPEIYGVEPSDMERVLRVERGENLESLGASDQEWEELFADVSEETMIVGGPGDGGLGPSTPFEMEKTLITYSAGEQRTTRSTGHFVFSSADRAAEILDTERETLVETFRGGTEGTLESVEQRGNRFVLTLLSDEELLP